MYFLLRDRAPRANTAARADTFAHAKMIGQIIRLAYS